MIKVNLLREQAPRAKKALRKPTVSRTSLLFATVFVLLLAGIGGAWYFVRHEISSLTETRDRLRTENERVLQWKKEIAEFERMKRLQERRISVIESLKDSQTGPVLLLNHIIRSMPKDDSVWLTLVDQKLERVQITGFVIRNESLPDFMTNLMATGFFKTVDLELFEDAKDRGASRFALTCTSTQKRMVE